MITQFTDYIFTEEYGQRIPLHELRELQSMLNVNLSDECDDWLDDDPIVSENTDQILTDEEFLDWEFSILDPRI